MTLLEWGALGELIGGIAIIGSLLYVGIQVKDSTRATRSAATNDASGSMQSWYQEMGSNRQASGVWINAMTSSDPLSTHDEFQFMMMMHAIIYAMQNSYLLNQEGTLDADYLDAISSIVFVVKDLPAWDRYWRQRRALLHRGFAEYVDGLLLQDSIESLDIYKRSENAPDK